MTIKPLADRVVIKMEEAEKPQRAALFWLVPQRRNPR